MNKTEKYNPDVYKYCAGYQYDDRTIVGFSHTHFSGTGHSDLGDFLVMPTVGELRLNPGTAGVPHSGFRSAFNHASETAEADYYKVRLEDYGIWAELTATTRVGFHQYTFPASDQAHIVLDCIGGIYNYESEDKNVWTYIRVVNDTLVNRLSADQRLGCRTRTVYFAKMTFPSPLTLRMAAESMTRDRSIAASGDISDQNHDFPDLAGRQLRAPFRLQYAGRAAKRSKMKFALSPVSMQGALLAPAGREAPGMGFQSKCAGRVARPGLQH